ncbi:MULTISPECIES: phage tail protein [unclassified Pseudomonas]|uniref:phage tail protein n=1 Tax=unclassified Pseudomonas TaxID=196821 RepID=UPI0008715CA7|nr:MULTISPECIES: phage tail protein [unclassified Pseudomonas]SCW78390.1 Phage-related tail fibre protein [Pseudomonas sp. NFACC05-1]SFL76587.1 Phage-related tail fibre protein [Pseudomonas sp. NFACC46-3]
MADYYTLLTDAGIAYETACKAAGTPIKLSQISVGDGGGEVYNPAATATALKREVWRGPLNALFQDEKNPSWLLAEVTIPPEVGGWYVREAGIWTDTGILYAIVKYPESFKPVLATSGSGKEFYIRSIFETSNAELVTLLIDDTVVKATRAWVASYVADELAKLDRKQSVRVATTGNIVLSGAQAIDGVAVVAGNRVLVKSQTLAKDNGIYVAANDAWVRAKDADASAEVTSGLIVSVEEGATLTNTIWQLVTDGAIVLGATGLVFQNITQGFAPLSSPAFQGNPTAPTPVATDNDTSIATTAFVRNVLARYGIASYGYVWNGNIDLINETGVYTFSDGSSGMRPKNPTTGADIPRGVFFHMERDNTLSALQIWESVNAGVALTFKRSRLSNGVWTAWAQLWDELNTPKQANPLDLTAGAMLAPGSFGIGKSIVGTETNLNNYTVSGIYLVPESGLVNIPPGWSATRRYNLTVGLAGVGSRLTQTLMSGMSGDAVGMAIRVCQENGTWTDWEEVTTSRHGPFKATQTYKSAGVFTWTVPAGVKKVWVTVIGGGGGGGRAGVSGAGSGGGGGGGWAQKLVDLSSVTSVTVTIGAGGAGATLEGASGDTGATSSFGSYLSATGGFGGMGSAPSGHANGPGSGGLGTGGDFNTSLGVGHVSYGPVGGSGGGPGARCTQGLYPGNTGVGPGGGGSGAYFGYNGGAGAAGNVIIQW